MIINHGKAILADHYEQKHWPQARKRLMRTALAAAATLTLYICIAIEFAYASGAFIPTN